MSPNKILIDFMLLKTKLMQEEKLRVDKWKAMPDYFTQEDAKAIRSWPKGQAEKVLQELTHNFKTGQCSDMPTCPFCIWVKLVAGIVKPTICKKICPYAENHGVCGSDHEENDYDKWEDYIDCISWRFQLLDILEEPCKKYQLK